VLFAGVDRGGRPLDRNVRFDSQEIAEGGALVVGELAVKTIRVEDGLALRLGHLAQIAEGAADQALTVRGKRAELLRGDADLLPLLRSEVLHHLVAFQQATALLLRHVVQLGEIVQRTLLGLRWQLAEAGFTLERSLLLGKRHVAVAIHPLFQVLLVRLGAGRGLGSSVGPLGRRGSRLPGLRMGLSPGKAWRGGKQKESREG
jgi:hypothetical protein